MSTDLDTLDILPSKPLVNGPHCGGCPNQCEGIRLIPPDGNGYSGVMIVGDSPRGGNIGEGRRPLLGQWSVSR